MLKKLKKQSFFVFQGLLVLALIAADQISKSLATKWLYFAIPIKLNAFLNLRLLYNTGAAFSFLSQAGHWHKWFFMIISSLAVIMITVWLYRLPKSEKEERLSLLLILSGAIGNLIDRIHLGYVVDFIELHYKNYSWPVFNLADSYICIGAAIFIFYHLKSNRKQAIKY